MEMTQTLSPCLIGNGMTLCRPPASQPLTRWSETIHLIELQ